MRTRMLANMGTGERSYRRSLLPMAIMFSNIAEAEGVPIDLVIEAWSLQREPQLSSYGRGVQVRKYIRVLYPYASTELLKARRLRARTINNRRGHEARQLRNAKHAT